MRNSASSGKPFTLPFGFQLPEFSIALIGYLLYLLAIIAFRFPTGTLGMIIGLVGLVTAGTLRFPPASPYLAGMLVCAAMGVSTSIDPQTSWAAVIEAGKVWLVALVGYNAVKSPRQVRFVLLFVLACYALVPTRPSLMGYVTGSMRHAGRLVGPFIYSNSNDLAAISLLALGLSLCALTLERSYKVLRVGLLSFSGALVIMILLTQSRGGFLGMLAMLVPYVLLTVRKSVGAVFMAAVVLIAVLLTVPSSAWTRLAGIKKLTSVETIDNADPEGSAAERFKIVKTASRIIAANPVFGVGLKTYPVANARYSPEVGKKDTHNTYLNLGAEIGIPGLVLYVLGLVAALRFTGRARQALRKSDPVRSQALGHLQRGLLGFMVASFFGSYAWLGILQVYLALICAVAATWAPNGKVVRRAPARNPQRVHGLWEPDLQGRRAS